MYRVLDAPEGQPDVRADRGEPGEGGEDEELNEETEKWTEDRFAMKIYLVGDDEEEKGEEERDIKRNLKACEPLLANLLHPQQDPQQQQEGDQANTHQHNLSIVFVASFVFLGNM